MIDKFTHATQNSALSRTSGNDYRVLLTICLSKWYWIVGTIVIMTLLAYVYLTLSTPVYSSHGLMKFDEKKTEITELISIRNPFDKINKIESEKSIIKSKSVVKASVRLLNYEIAFYKKNLTQTINIYPRKPFQVKLVTGVRKATEILFAYRRISKDRFSLSYEVSGQPIKQHYCYGDTISLGVYGSIIISPEVRLNEEEYFFRINDPDKLSESIRQKLRLEDDLNTNILKLTLTGDNPYLVADMLNGLMRAYLSFDRNQRRSTANQTGKYISRLMGQMEDSVSLSASRIQHFIEQNPLKSMSRNPVELMKLLAETDNDMDKLEIESRLADQSIAQIRSSRDELINQITHGESSHRMDVLYDKYNDLEMKRRQLRTVYHDDHPIIQQADQMKMAIKNSLLKNLSMANKNRDQSIHKLTDRQDNLLSELSTQPKRSRQLAALQSAFDINQKVYSYLGEKKLEAEIAKSAVTAGASIIDPAEYAGKAVSPLPYQAYVSFNLTGIIGVIAIIFLKRRLNNIIYHAEQVSVVSRTPVLGIVYKFTGKSSGYLAHLADPRSLFSESIRNIRSNLGFYCSSQQGTLISITSEVSGEGKSFIASNLSIALTLNGKKVLILGLDLRKSKFHEAFSTTHLNGLSTYLSGQSTIADIIQHTQVEGLDIALSGPLPPNPSELLDGPRFSALLDHCLQKYDYVIADNAPIGLVSDAKPVLKESDVVLFVVRSGVSKVPYAETPDLLKSELGLKNVAIILNDYLQNDLYVTNGGTRQSGDPIFYQPQNKAAYIAYYEN